MSFKLSSSYFWEFLFFFFSFCTCKGHFLQVFYFTLCRKADWLMIGIYKKLWFERCFEPVTRRFSWEKKIEIAIKNTKLLKCFGAYFIQETPKFNLSHQPYQKEHLLKCVVCVSITSKFLLLFFSKDSSGLRKFSPSDVFQNLFKIFKVFCGGKRPIVWITWLMCKWTHRDCS